MMTRVISIHEVQPPKCTKFLYHVGYSYMFQFKRAYHQGTGIKGYYTKLN